MPYLLAEFIIWCVKMVIMIPVYLIKLVLSPFAAFKRPR